MAGNPVTKKSSNPGRPAIIQGINNPLGFFVLALLIVETFLTLVLTYANIPDDFKIVFVWVGCTLFVLVITIVSLLVWHKPENLTFDKNAHLDRGKVQYGSDKQPIKADKRFENQTTQD